ncbi:MAG: DUF3486 family protein [Spirochaetaceae bacterium]|nr:DUF3486 family protein [Spirochaetaceae bacterium]
MAKSSIDRLSPELRQKLHELLAHPEVTQQEVAEALNQAAGETVVSKSAVNRYAVKMRKISERNRQAREVAELYLEQAGPDAQNRIGEVVIHQVRQLAFDLMLAMEDLTPDSPEAIEQIAKLISQLSRSARDMESAATANAERRRKLQEDVAAAAADVERTASAGGLSKETVAELRRRILGIAA